MAEVGAAQEEEAQDMGALREMDTGEFRDGVGCPVATLMGLEVELASQRPIHEEQHAALVLGRRPVFDFNCITS